MSRQEKIVFNPEEIARAVAIRHDLHQHPELKYEERRTAELVAQELASLGYEVYTGADYDMQAESQIPPLVNPPEQASIALEAACQYLPQNEIQQLDYMPTMGAEDFAFYLEQVPGCFFFVGIGEDTPYLHNEQYDFNDAILETAAGVFVAIAKHYLS